MATSFGRAALLAALLSQSLLGFAHAAPERTLLSEPRRAIANFTLTNQHGAAVQLAELRGAPVLVFFGFTHCPTVCPTALQQLRQLHAQHRQELGDARIVVISVDGERDTPAALSAWLAPVSTDFVGLTGPTTKVRDIASQFSAAFYKTPGKTPESYLVEHNSQIFLLDAQGRLHATFFNAPVKTMAAVTHALVREGSGQESGGALAKTQKAQR